MSEFFEWLSDNSWVGWAGAGFLLAIAELMSLDLVLLMLATGAFAGAVTAAVGVPLALNVLVAVIVSTGMLYVVRPSAVQRLHHGPALVDGHAALVGHSAVVTHEIGADGGRIKLDGEVWTARSYDDRLTVPVGTTVSVFEIDGATAVVYPQD